ncbi:hypothetical protein CVD28_00715 [Bacillus sp. M6-12]|uniref:hypothetical protein n=1 Tax=Bacillus sp. M6-12 TaxID=2054166 RepID=UPI000C793247|nr:hypothetical protein [Bacillus sp. M6-12]PLS18955.1 hypothetical protein CVD28_00715 [Bacillus sp. M6-12]
MKKKKVIGLSLTGVITLALVGCGAEVTEKSIDIKNEGEVANNTENSLGTSIDVTNIEKQNDTILIKGKTTLPEGSSLSVSYELSGQKPEDTYLGVNGDTIVKEGQFKISLTPPKVPEFENGKHQVSVMFTPRGQSDDVLKIVGKDGENLTGNFISNKYGFNTVNVVNPVDLDIKKTEYPMIDISSYKEGTIERAVAEYFISWKNKDWNKMKENSQVSWVQNQSNPIKELKNFYEFKDVIGIDIKSVQKINEATAEVIVYTDFSIGNDVFSKILKAKVINENGHWGVNPYSTVNEK